MSQPFLYPLFFYDKMQQKVKKCDIILSYKNSIKENEMSNSIKFIDLFAGIGGIRKGFENACEELGLKTECVLTTEIKEHAIKILKQNHPDETIEGDITKIDTKSIKDFDFLLAGFPCQPFSSAGKRLGFSDTRGTMFFEVERILRDKKPFGFVLENVEGLVNHDKEKPSDKIGRTLLSITTRNFWRVVNRIPAMFHATLIRTAANAAIGIYSTYFPKSTIIKSRTTA